MPAMVTHSIALGRTDKRVKGLLFYVLGYTCVYVYEKKAQKGRLRPKSEQKCCHITGNTTRKQNNYNKNTNLSAPTDATKTIRKCAGLPWSTEEAENRTAERKEEMWHSCSVVRARCLGESREDRSKEIWLPIVCFRTGRAREGRGLPACVFYSSAKVAHVCMCDILGGEGLSREIKSGKADAGAAAALYYSGRSFLSLEAIADGEW